MTVTISGTDGIVTPGLTNTGTETLVNLTTTGNTTLGDASTDTLNVGNGGLVKDASGNVGVGVTPSAWSTSFRGFQVGGAGSVWSIASGFGGTYLGNNYYYSASGRTYLNTNTAVEIALASGGIQFSIAPSGTAGTAVSFTQAMTLDTSGNLLVGVTSQVGSGRFCVKNDSTHNGIVSQDAGTSNFLYLGIDSTAQQVFYVTPAGNVRILSGATYGTISDRKYKKNIVDATPKLQDLLKIKVRNYNLVNNDSEKYIGWIAQEVEEVFPSMVFEDKDKDQDGNDLNTITKGVKESAFIPILVKAIQEQSALITTLTDRITALENK